MPSPTQPDSIAVIGARTHNLRGIDVEIPLHSLTVVTGVSGSGKSTLAFDTLYAEGQRRYVASLSAYARQFLERVERPDVTDILGICPALAIRQKSCSRNPRSTVGTVTEINDHLRLLFARIGTTVCRRCGRTVEKDSPEKVADTIMSLPHGIRLYLCIPLRLDGGAPAGRQRRPPDDPAKRLQMILPGLQQQGFARLLIRDRLVEPAEAVAAFRENPVREIHVVVDRLTVKDGMRGRLVDSLELCARESEGRMEVLVLPPESSEPGGALEQRFPQLRWAPHPAGLMLRFTERFECPLCRLAYEAPEPGLFSFNSPFGACPECQGFGNTVTVDLSLVIPDPQRNLSDGAILLQFAEQKGIDCATPWQELPEEHRTWIIHGADDFPGVLGFFQHLEGKKYKMHVRIFISRYRGYITCPTCAGDRLRREAQGVRVGGRSISQIQRMTVTAAAEFFSGLVLTEEQAAIAERILCEIRHRLDLLQRVGLRYLSLDRLSSSLSGGESQRIQLATALGSTLVGALYVLDEPSIGLHPRDSRRLLQILQSLKDLGNTVLVVEHDGEVMARADHLIDLGPGAGEHGGCVVYQGPFAGIFQARDSLTGRYLRGDLRIPTPVFRRRNDGRCLQVLQAGKHNLKDLDVRIPLGIMTCVTGVSGSGKSTLVHDVLYHSLRRAKGHAAGQESGCRSILGMDLIRDAVLVDQAPIGKTPRSNPATYIKAFDLVRQIFAGTRDAAARNLKASHFSFNLPGGRCETCQGNGSITVEMQFLADVDLPCEDCKGARFKSSVLEVRYKGKNIREVLDLTVTQAIGFFGTYPRLVKKLRILDDIGLGYLRLGQASTSLSGGEAQRIKLASFISGAGAHRMLYIFDEPTTGLHFDDIRKLLSAFDKLVHAGNTLLVIEHNLDVIKTADWVIDLGPEGGDEGGRLVFEGTPDDLVHCEKSLTGRFLREHLERAAGRNRKRRTGIPREAPPSNRSTFP
ncbi:MAG: excinuclease ABC subunit A [Acidobacteria bacterium]|nr:excinuclease ABC subunit A [Acidobacteriota bacterium]